MKSGALFFRFEGRRRNAHGKCDDISFVGIVCHGVGADRRFGVDTLQTEEAELFPGGEIQITDQALIDVLVVVHREGRNLDLCIGSRLKVHVLSRRQLHFELFDERCHVAVADHGALPFLDAHNAFGDFDGKVALYFRLAAQTPIVLDFFTREMSLFRVENLSSTFNDLAFALTARTFTATCGGQIHTVLGKCGEQASALLDL